MRHRATWKEEANNSYDSDLLPCYDLITYDFQYRNHQRLGTLGTRLQVLPNILSGSPGPGPDVRGSGSHALWSLGNTQLQRVESESAFELGMDQMEGISMEALQISSCICSVGKIHATFVFVEHLSCSIRYTRGELGWSRCFSLVWYAPGQSFKASWHDSPLI